ncbi:hypothetical protein [Sinimarinibacterium flocculans]|uniref:Helix-destabilizing protein n=1 Tax=Sinimarinibacterium flocculans TaxID=985250 RepID=A0A318DZB0_9GAMM|nr:hypothetical protein [Sinimarinibacterium flocculans]PXV63060.1 helix-destabilizing protein [Sinimarinibacterium flocculans]
MNDKVKDALGGIVIEIPSGDAINKAEKVNPETGEIVRKAHRVQLCYVHLPDHKYPKEMLRLVAKGESPLPAGDYTLDVSKLFANFSWGRIEFSLRDLVPLAQGVRKVA